MRLEVSIPDQLYGRAQLLADQAGVSFDKFISDAVQLRLSDDSEQFEEVLLTPSQIEIIEVSRAEIRAGNFLTAEQVSEHFVRKKAEWKSSHSA